MAEVEKDLLEEACSAIKLVVGFGSAEPQTFKFDKAEYEGQVRATLEVSGGDPVFCTLWAQFDWADPIIEQEGEFDGITEEPRVVGDRYPGSRVLFWYPQTYSRVIHPGSEPYSLEYWVPNPYFQPNGFNPEAFPDYADMLTWGLTPQEAAELINSWYMPTQAEFGPYRWFYGEPQSVTLFVVTAIERIGDTAKKIGYDWHLSYRNFQSFGGVDENGNDVALPGGAGGGKSTVRLYERLTVESPWELRATLQWDAAVSHVQLFNWDDCDDACVPVFKVEQQNFVCICKGGVFEGDSGRSEEAEAELDQLVY